MHSTTFRALLEPHVRAVTFRNEGESIGPHIGQRRIVVDDRVPPNELVEALVLNLEHAEYE